MAQNFATYLGTSLVHILDIIFPPTHDMLLVRSTTLADLKNAATKSHANGFISYLNYGESRIRACIHEAKFHNNRNAQKLLGALLSEMLKDMPQKTILPIPLSRKRQAERGYNQVEEILRFSNVDRLHLIEKRVLRRSYNTRPQTELSREKRLKNVKDAFKVRKPQKIQGRDILLIDDVVTTGATLNAANAALLPHHPHSITCVALAYAKL